MPGNAGLEVEKKCCEHGCLATVLSGYPQLGELFLCGKGLRDAAYTTGALAAACPALIVRTLAERWPRRSGSCSRGPPTPPTPRQPHLGPGRQRNRSPRKEARPYPDLLRRRRRRRLLVVVVGVVVVGGGGGGGGRGADGARAADRARARARALGRKAHHPRARLGPPAPAQVGLPRLGAAYIPNDLPRSAESRPPAARHAPDQVSQSPTVPAAAAVRAVVPSCVRPSHARPNPLSTHVRRAPTPPAGYASLRRPGSYRPRPVIFTAAA